MAQWHMQGMDAEVRAPLSRYDGGAVLGGRQFSNVDGTRGGRQQSVYSTWMSGRVDGCTCQALSELPRIHVRSAETASAYGQ